MAEIQQNRYDALVRRVCGIVGAGSMVNDSLTELFPVLDVENLPGELMFLAGMKLAHGGAGLAAGAGEFPQINLVNPADSGHIMTISSVVIEADAVNNMSTALAAEVVNTDVGSAAVRDTRSGIMATAGRVDTAVPLAAIASVNIFRISAASPLTLRDPNGVAVLSPGNMYQVGCLTSNQTIRVSYWWRERAAEPSELNF